MTKKKHSISSENEEIRQDPEENEAREEDVERGATAAEVTASREPDSAAAGEDEPSTKAEDGVKGSLEEQLAAAREESRQNHERYLRTVADWENYRRRMTREKEELRHHSVAGLLEEFLPVLDNLDLGLQSAANHPEAANVAKGFQMVADQIRAILEKNGIKEIAPEGEEFDPHKHESVSHQPDEKVPDGHVMHVIRKGYALNDRLLRPASVVVSSGPSATGDTTAEG